MNRAFTIMRVSSHEQKKKYGFAVQWEDDILFGAEALGLEVSRELSREVDESATKAQRSDFTACVREAIDLHNKGEVDALLFPRVDRESRDAFISIPLLNECFANGLPVYFAKEELHLDPTDLEAKKKYLEEVNRSMDYIITLKRNTERGRKKRVKSGLFAGGCSSNLFGFDYDKGHRVINHETGQTVKQIFQWYLEGDNMVNITARLHSLGIKSPLGKPNWERSTIFRILINRAYTGRADFGGIEIEQPALITMADFERVQLRLKRNRELARRNAKYDYLLSGHVVCSLCGRRYTGATTHRKNRSYVCSRGRNKTRLNPCDGKPLRADSLEEVVWMEVERALQNPKLIQAGLEAVNEHDYEPELVALKARLRYYKAERRRLFDAFRISVDEETFRESIKQIDTDEASANRRYAEIEGLIKTADQTPTPKDIQTACDLIGKNIERLDFEDRRRILEALKVKVHTGTTVRIEGSLPIELPPSRPPLECPQEFYSPGLAIRRKIHVE